MGEYIPDAAEESAERLPPHSDEAEQAVLGCVIMSPQECIPECINSLKAGPQAFYNLKHKVIYEVLLDMWAGGRHIEIMTLKQELADLMVLKNVGGLQYVASLPDLASSAANLSHYLAIVVDKFIRRQIIKNASTALEQAFTSTTSADELAANASAALSTVANGSKDSKTLHTATVLLDVVENRISKFIELQGAIDGIPTGLVDVDKFVQGLKPGQVTVIAARPAAGKSSLGLNIAEHVAIDLGIPVAFFSLEMQASDLMFRLVCGRAKVRPNKIASGVLDDGEMQRLSAARTDINNRPLYIDEQSELSVFQLRARAELMRSIYGIQLIVIDYLQLMRGPPGCNSRQEEVSAISGAVTAVAKALKIPIVLLAQLNREQEKGGNRRPRLSDLRESGSIEQNADIVLMLYRDTKNKPEDEESGGANQFMEVIHLLIAKHRHGPTGEVKLAFLKPYTKFTCMTQ